MAKLRPRARIVRTIGDQLISGPEAALIELVKNAYDADSPEVRISISPRRGLDGKSPGRIIVADSGHGMTANDLLERWFEPATTNKVDRHSSPGGRVMLGAKGVGRFATARLGRHLTLTSKSCGESGQTEVSRIEVNWDDFEHEKYLDQVDVGIHTQVLTNQSATGVCLDISDLRDDWTRQQLELLVKELRRLISPRDAHESNFKVFLDLSAFQKDADGFDGKALVSGPLAELSEPDPTNDPTQLQPFGLSDIYHYRVQGEFDESGAFFGTFKNNRSDAQEYSLQMDAPNLEDDQANCGPFKLTLNIYDRKADDIKELFETLNLGAVGGLEARRILDENIGIGIYRGGFRIRPYGDAETDWLELESKRVQNPSHKLGLNQVWGLVDIGDEKVSGLVERSSREGLEHNSHFKRLKSLVAMIMAQVEQLRFDFREKAGLGRKQAGDTADVRAKASLQATQRAVAQLPEQYRKKIERALHQDGTALKTAIEDLETYQQALASRSALGLVVSQVLHDGRRFLSDITTRSKRLADGAPRLMEQSSFGEHFRTSFPKDAASIHESALGVNKLFKALDPVSGRRRGRPKALKVADVLSRCLELFQDSIKGGSIEVEVHIPDDLPEAEGHESDLMASLLNVIDNAIHWLGISTTRPRKLIVIGTYSKKYVRIALSNNGPKIEERFVSRLFTPGFTLKPEGSGIGLAIAREAMRGSKGDVAYDDTADGTTFVIEMRRERGKS